MYREQSAVTGRAEKQILRLTAARPATEASRRKSRRRFTQDDARWVASARRVTAFAAMSALLLVLLSAVAASAQSVDANQGVEEEFAAYHDALSGVANRLLQIQDAPTQRVLATPWPGPAQRAAAEQLAPATNAAGGVAPANPVGVARARVEQLRPVVEPILRQEGVPASVMAVVMVESGGRPTAVSPKGAAGLWQLMPATARRYGLTVSEAKDERFDLLRATRAAARYLHDLYGQFGDWNLAFAAYNAGEDVVQRALARVGSRDFMRISRWLPSETQHYVPAVASAVPLFGRTQFETEAIPTARSALRVIYATASESGFMRPHIFGGQ